MKLKIGPVTLRYIAKIPIRFEHPDSNVARSRNGTNLQKNTIFLKFPFFGWSDWESVLTIMESWSNHYFYFKPPNTP